MSRGAVGYNNRASLNSNGYVASGGVITNGPDSHFITGNARGISDSGTLVGFTFSGGHTYGSVGPQSAMQTFSAAPGTETYAWGISGDGSKVAGYYYPTGQSWNQQMFIRDGNTVTTFSYTGTHAQQYLWDVNDAGDSVGETACCNAGVGFLRKANGTFTLIDITGYNVIPYGLSDDDTVVGAAYYDYQNGGYTKSRGFIWRDGTVEFYDVSGAAYTQLFDINSSGRVFGGWTAADNSGAAFFLDPVATPEPATAALSAAALALAYAARRRR